MGLIQRISRLLRSAPKHDLPDYEKILADNFRKFLKAGDCVADVGAHTGAHTREIVKAVGPTGRVIAFEPLKQCYQSLVREFKGLPNVRIENVALSDFLATECSFTEASGTPQESGLRQRKFNHPQRAKPKKIKVSVSTLDFALSSWERLDYIKIDVEGGELDCLMGGAKTIARCRPIISFECGYDAFEHYGKTTADFIAYAIAGDFRIFDILGNPIRDEHHLITAMTSRWDFYFVPSVKCEGFTARLFHSEG